MRYDISRDLRHVHVHKPSMYCWPRGRKEGLRVTPLSHSPTSNIPQPSGYKPISKRRRHGRRALRETETVPPPINGITLVSIQQRTSIYYRTKTLACGIIPKCDPSTSRMIPLYFMDGASPVGLHVHDIMLSWNGILKLHGNLKITCYSSNTQKKKILK